MQESVQPTSRDQGHLLSIGMQTQFQHTVGSIAHQLDGPIGKPSANEADHLMRPHPDGLVSLAQPFTHALRVVANTHRKGKAHLCFVQGSVTTTAIMIQRRPGLLTERSLLERALSR
jgi:hypothetical protein